MPIQDLIPVAEYVRMSSDDQKYSIPCQQAANRHYAAEHGFCICRTYADPGKSGVVLKHRQALNQLLRDVRRRETGYKAILVYDVNRWGRFQNPDEAAYYEFICAKAGIPVHYCAEPFSNDGSLQAWLMKALKRTMAGEFSRELGVKVFDALRRLVLQGFHAGAIAPYGLERLLISPTGRRKGILKTGQRKNLKTDKVVLISGKRNEVKIVRRIFSMCANEKRNCVQIAAELNERQVKHRNKPWTADSIIQILHRAEYLGLNVWGRRTQRLHGRSSLRPLSEWVTSTAPFAPIIDQATFDRAHQVLTAHRHCYSDDTLLTVLKRILARKRRLTSGIIERGRAAGRSGVYQRRFGSLLRAYELAGFKAPSSSYAMSEHSRKSKATYKAILLEIQRLFPNVVRIVSSANRQKAFVEIDTHLRVSIIVCGKRARLGTDGEFPWLLRIHPRDRQNIALLCILDSQWTHVVGYYLLPPIKDSLNRSHAFHRNDAWLNRSAHELKSLNDFVNKVRTLGLSPDAHPPRSIACREKVLAVS
jgi:DNA invertase Pin-like site-specific DNA recombinase